MNTYWKIKTCLADKRKGSIAIRLYPEMEFYELDKWGAGYWERRMKHGIIKKRFYSKK